MSDIDKDAALETLAEKLVADVGEYATPTPYLMWGADGNLKQKWVGRDGQVWVNVLAEPKVDASATTPAPAKV